MGLLKTLVKILSSAASANEKQITNRTNNINEQTLTIPSPVSKPRYPYILTDCILTPKEFKFYIALKRITDELELIIFSKIRIADLVYIQKSNPEYMKWFNHIKAKHVDFLLCNADLKPLLIIEVDDKTHYRQSRIERDKFVDEIFTSLKLPILHIWVWDDTALRKTIILALKDKKFLCHL